MTLNRRQFLTLAAGAALIPARAAQAIADRPDTLFHWQGGGPFFGGFSAIELSTDRSRLLTVSDRAFAVRARMIRDADGRLLDVEKTGHFSLAGDDGAPLHGRRADSEGMDQRPDGTLFLSFEGRARVERYDDERGTPQPLPRPPAWRDLPGNGGLEALAIDAQGAVYTLPETPDGDAFPLWRLTDDWRIAARIPQRDGFVPVGADFGPDGNLYLLERKFRLAFFANRISRLRPGALNDPETLVETGLGRMDNHEGISITQDAAGALWATTISDDNQSRLQRTEIAEFRLA